MTALLTPGEFRVRFPMLERTVYLASCSLGARSVDLDAALARMLAVMADDPVPWHAFEEQARLAREGFAALIGARPEQIALLPNASVATYQVASTVDVRDRPKVVLGCEDFPSQSHVWLAQRGRGVEVAYAAADGYPAVVDRRTALVSVPAVAYQDGRRLPVAEIAALARAAGARVLVDAYQALGVEPVDVTALDCDFLVGGASKYLLGLPGLAFLYVRAPASGDRQPTLTGWFGRVDPFAFDPGRLDFPDAARRFETGTPPVSALYAANAGLGLLRQVGPAAVRVHVRELVALAARRLTGQGEKIRAGAGVDPDRQGAHVALADPDPVALAGRLAERGVRISPRGQTARIAFHYYNTAEDVYRVCAEIARCRGR